MGWVPGYRHDSVLWWARGEREKLQAQLDALAKTRPPTADPALLDELPLLGDIRPDLPPRLKARLLAAFALSILWNKPGDQPTVCAEITETTLQALPGILDSGQDGDQDTPPRPARPDRGQHPYNRANVTSSWLLPPARWDGKFY